MTYEELENGLRDRGFVGVDEFCNKGDCHKDEKHFILVTDGLIIYSNMWDYHMCDDDPNGLCEYWCFEWSECDVLVKEFEWWQLDEIMKI